MSRQPWEFWDAIVPPPLSAIPPSNIRDAIEAYLARYARGEVKPRVVPETDSQPIRTI